MAKALLPGSRATLVDDFDQLKKQDLRRIKARARQVAAKAGKAELEEAEEKRRQFESLKALFTEMDQNQINEAVRELVDALVGMVKWGGKIYVITKNLEDVLKLGEGIGPQEGKE